MLNALIQIQRQVLQDLTYMQNLKQLNSEAESKMVVIKGWRGGKEEMAGQGVQSFSYAR